MDFLSTLFVAIFAFLLTAFLAPKPSFEDAKPGQLGDFRFPRSDEGYPIAIFWGRVRFRGPNTLWYGNLTTRRIRQKVKTGLFSSKRVTIGHEYSLTIDLALGLVAGSSARLRRIWFGEKEGWVGNIGGGSDAVVANIDMPELFGGYKDGGGAVGTVRFYPGTFTQGVNAHMTSLVPDGTLLPAYRGLVHLVFEGFEFGESTSLPVISVEVEAIPNGLGLGGVGSNGDANPAEILYDIITNDWGRLGFDASVVNAASFREAGRTLAAENHGMSLKIENANDARDVIQEILKEIDGLIYEDPFTRQVYFRLIRDDYDIDELPVFDENNIREIGNYSVSSWSETYNQARVIYNDRESDYKDKTGFAQDLSNIEVQGRIRSADYRYPGISNADLANRIASRELNFTSIPLTKMRLTVTRDATDLRPGDVFRLSWPEYGIVDFVLRVQRFDFGTLDDNRVVIDCIQDRFAVSEVVFSDPPASSWIPPEIGPRPIETRRIIELPRFLNERLLAAEGAALGTDPDESYLQHLALAPNALQDSFEAQVSEDAGATYNTDNPYGSFTATALLNADVALNTEEQFTGSSPIVLKNISNTAAVLSPAIEDQIRIGANLLLIGTEIIAFRGATDNADGTHTLVGVYRGMLDTSLRAHAEDDRVWFLSFVEIENFGEANFLGIEDLQIRLLSQTGAGNQAEQNGAVSGLSLVERPRRPYPPDDFRIDGELNPTTLQVSDTPFDLSWKRRDRRASNATFAADDDETPESGTTYLARWTVDRGPAKTADLGSGTTALLDFGATPGAIELEIVSVFGGRECLFPVRREFDYV